MQEIKIGKRLIYRSTKFFRCPGDKDGQICRVVDRGITLPPQLS